MDSRRENSLDKEDRAALRRAETVALTASCVGSDAPLRTLRGRLRLLLLARCWARARPRGTCRRATAGCLLRWRARVGVVTGISFEARWAAHLR